MKNNNAAIVRKIIRKSLQSNRKRNFFIVIAIMLTTFMIASVLSIGISYSQSMDNYIGLQEERYGENASIVYTLGEPDSLGTMIAYAAMIAFLMLAGYLLIYNVLHISIANDVRFYGLLKTIGTTPRQIKHVVTGQILSLCLIAIPLGLLLAALLANVIIPLIVLVETGAVISFSPLIYIGAAFFALATALMGVAVPVKKASAISPVEAAKYSDGNVSIQRSKGSANGKPYKMATRNIFREKKRAAVVFLSLFLGLSLYVMMMTIVSSMDADQYADSYVEGDFLLKQASSWGGPQIDVFDDELLESIKMVAGFADMHINTNETASQKYDVGYDAYLKTKTDGNAAMMAYYRGNFQGFVGGIDKDAIGALNQSLSAPLDIEAFERGEFALIATDSPGLFSTLKKIELTLSNGETFSIPLGGFAPDFYKWIGEYTAPTVFVSNAFLARFTDAPSIDSVDIYADKENAPQALAALRSMVEGNRDIELISRLEERQVVENAKMILSVLGGAVSVILGLIGVMNFMNIMSVGILARKREIATLECIGMTRKQTRSMLVCEGSGYALITLLLVLTIGNAATMGIYGLFESTQRHGSYSLFSFSYPAVPIAVTSLVVLAICIITPMMIYRSINRSSIVERLREAE